MCDALPMLEHTENDGSKEALDRYEDVFQNESQDAREKVLHEVAEEANIDCSIQATFLQPCVYRWPSLVFSYREWSFSIFEAFERSVC